MSFKGSIIVALFSLSSIGASYAFTKPDSLKNRAKDETEILLDYINQIEKEADKHEQYVQLYYDRTFWSVGIIIAAALGVFTFYERTTFKQIKKDFEKII